MKQVDVAQQDFSGCVGLARGRASVLVGERIRALIVEQIDDQAYEQICRPIHEQLNEQVGDLVYIQIYWQVEDETS